MGNDQNRLIIISSFSRSIFKSQTVEVAPSLLLRSFCCFGSFVLTDFFRIPWRRSGIFFPRNSVEACGSNPIHWHQHNHEDDHHPPSDLSARGPLHFAILPSCPQRYDPLVVPYPCPTMRRRRRRRRLVADRSLLRRLYSPATMTYRSRKTLRI